MNNTCEFAIVGAGVAGLSLAIGLTETKRDFLVFERATELRGIGAGFGLAANAMRAFDLLGIREGVEKLGFYTKTFDILDQKGDVLIQPNTSTMSETYNQKNFTIHRADLHQYLLSHIDNRNIILGKEATGYQKNSNGITIQFRDGSICLCKYLIVADGVKSSIRQSLLPRSTPRYAGYTCWRATIPKKNIQLHEGSETWGNAGRFGMVPLVRDRIYWYACINSKPDNPIYKNFQIADLQAHFKDYHHLIPEILLETENRDLIWNDIIDVKPITKFRFGNILLIGDAAHAATPNMGQGACQALEDVVVLLDEMKKNKDISQAFQNFEHRRMSRTKYITDTSWLAGKVAQWSHPIAILLRNRLLRALPARLTQRNLQKLLEVDFMTIATNS